jgi:hypothetical protein
VEEIIPDAAFDIIFIHLEYLTQWAINKLNEI